MNPKDRLAQRKVNLALVPMTAVIHEARAMEYGAFSAPNADGGIGYGPFNWRLYPVSATVYAAAGMRHYAKWFDGLDYDPTSGAHELGHARSCFGILLDAMEQGNLIDDRPTKGQSALLLDRLHKDKGASTHVTVEKRGNEVVITLRGDATEYAETMVSSLPADIGVILDDDVEFNTGSAMIQFANFLRKTIGFVALIAALVTLMSGQQNVMDGHQAEALLDIYIALVACIVALVGLI